MQEAALEEYADSPASHLLDSANLHYKGDVPYAPLTTHQHNFRLLEIVPQTKGTARIQVRATIRDLQSAAYTYTALSYTWGRPDTACTIELNGRAVNIRKNLWRFLHQARCSASLCGKLFWVDSLCIDQTNEAERNHQVGLMAQIYSKAEQVLIWLGPAYDNSGAAMKALRRYAKHKSIVRDIWWKSEAAALRGICERVYWTRLWVLQELALAKKAMVMCGQDSISWSTFEAFFVDAQRDTPKSRQVVNLSYIHTTQSRAITMMERVVAAQQKATLYNQMLASKRFGCADVKDKVYALLGIVELGQDVIVPDYSAELSALLNIVLRNEHNKTGVKDLRDVISQCEALAEAVGMDSRIIFDIGGEVSIGPSSTGSQRNSIEDDSGVSILWALTYGHTLVESLWLSKNGLTALNHALLHAISTGYETACRLILSVSGVDVNYQRSHLSTDGASPEAVIGTPLVVAAKHGHEGIVQLLLSDSRTDVMKWTDVNQSPLGAAISSGHIDVVGMIAHHARDMPPWEKYKLILDGLNEVLTHERSDVFSLLLEQLDYTELSSEGQFTSYQHIVLRAAERQEQEFLSLILTALDLEALHLGGCGMRRVSMEGARLGRWAVLLQLLQKDGFGEEDMDNAVLIFAAHADRDEVVARLLDLPYVDPNAIYALGSLHKLPSGPHTILSIALRRRSRKMAETILSKIYSAPITQDSMQILLESLNWAFTESENGALGAFLASDLSAHINWDSLIGESALCIAAANGQLQLVDQLLQRGLVDVNRISTIRGRGFWGDTALRWATRSDHTAVAVRLLSEPDIDVNLMESEYLPGTLSLAQGEVADLLSQRGDIERNHESIMNYRDSDDVILPDLLDPSLANPTSITHFGGGFQSLDNRSSKGVSRAHRGSRHRRTGRSRA